MKRLILLVPVLVLSMIAAIAQTPLSQNGRLKLVGNQLSNECGSPVQLRGVSTHGVMFHQECYKESAVASIANYWGASVLRLAIYTENVGGTAGYINGDKAFWDNWIDLMVGYAKDNGMYVVIDWHILEDSNPNTYLTEAKTFFATMSDKYKDEKHVIYEICNEPNGGADWGQIKSYASQVIPVIRANDKEGIIIVGTPQWSSDLWAAANDPITGDDAHNLMYAFHFYANSHYDYDKLRQTAGEIPIFISEWGSVDASGNGGFNSGSSDNWLSIANGNNSGGVTLSSCNWAFVDKDEAASILNVGACDSDDWTDKTSQAGNYIYNYLQGAGSFTTCNSAGDDDGDNVSNGDDLCPGTAPNTFVDGDGCPALQGDTDLDGVIDANDICPNTTARAVVNTHGCEIYNSFVSNVCEGFNNKQAYAYQTFTEDTLANVDIWNRPENGSPVYSATVSNGTLNIGVTDGDPDFLTQGFSFGELYRFNGTDYDTTLVPIDLRANATVKIDVRFEGNGYSLSDVMFDMQLEDENGDVVTSDATGVLFREMELGLNEWHTLEYNFAAGLRESWEPDTCAKYNTPKPENKPCYIDQFDFSHVSKVLMWVNPGAGASWAKAEAFNGTWRIDNFSIGLDGSPSNCDQTRDDDGDGVRIEDDKCLNTAPGESVDGNGCSSSQLDTDNDGVSNLYDECPETPTNEVVDFKGCAGFEADDDNDGVTNDIDECPETGAGIDVNAKGCAFAVGVSNEFADVLNIFPIPATNSITIEQSTMNFSSVLITDLTGVTVLSSALVASSEVIDLSGLAAGTYLVKLTGANASEAIKIVVK